MCNRLSADFNQQSGGWCPRVVEWYTISLAPLVFRVLIRYHYDNTMLSTLQVLCERNPLLTSGSPQKGSVIQNFGDSVDVNQNQLLNKQSRGMLTHWGRVMHICIGKLATIGSDNGLSPDRRQAIIWTIAEILLIRPLGTNFIEILIKILPFSFKKMRL